MFTIPASRMTKAVVLFVSITMVILSVQAIASQGDSQGPQEISADVSCGKCGMFPAKYPEWQSQVVFKDGSMTPFDGCKCMFSFMYNMSKFDTAHSKDDIAEIWVKDFKSGTWIDATSATFVVGSGEMGPMGKELIPFQTQTDAEAFQKEKGGQVTGYDAITMATLKPLMGKMDMKGKMKMDGKMMMNGKMMSK